MYLNLFSAVNIWSSYFMYMKLLPYMYMYHTEQNILR